MLVYSYIVLTTLLCKVTSQDLESLDMIQNAIEILDGAIQADLKTGLAEVVDRIEGLVHKTEITKIAVLKVIEGHTNGISIKYQTFTNAMENVKKQDKNYTFCAEGFPQTLADIEKRGAITLTKVLSASAKKIKGTILSMRPVIIGPIENKTLDMIKKATVCTYTGDFNCLDSVLTNAEILSVLAAPIIENVMQRIDLRLQVYDTEMRDAAQRVVNAVLGEHEALIFRFIRCIL